MEFESEQSKEVIPEAPTQRDDYNDELINQRLTALGSTEQNIIQMYD